VTTDRHGMYTTSSGGIMQVDSYMHSCIQRVQLLPLTNRKYFR